MPLTQEEARDAPPEVAVIHFDGGGQVPGPVVSAAEVRLSDGTVCEPTRRFEKGTHNTAEYEALLLGLRTALDAGERRVRVFGDSSLIVDQVNRKSRALDPKMVRLLAEVDELLDRFEDWQVSWVPREENARADALCRAELRA